MPTSDRRLAGRCVHCGGPPATADHVPPRAFLDRPYPEALAVVPSCTPCNQQASADEEYVACVLEIAANGTANVDHLERTSIAKSLAHSTKLHARLAEAYDGTEPSIETDRVTNVLTKAARGLWTYETSAADDHAEINVVWWPMIEANAERTSAFTTLNVSDLLPEIGSRLMYRTFEDWQMGNEWQVVQPERFAYAIETGSGGDRVKMIVRGYLAVEATIER